MSQSICTCGVVILFGLLAWHAQGERNEGGAAS